MLIPWRVSEQMKKTYFTNLENSLQFSGSHFPEPQLLVPFLGVTSPVRSLWPDVEGRKQQNGNFINEAMNGDKISTPQMLLRYQHLPMGKQRTVPFEAIRNNSGKKTRYRAGQNTIFDIYFTKPDIPEIRRLTLLNHHLGPRSCEVAIIWPERGDVRA